MKKIIHLLGFLAPILFSSCDPFGGNHTKADFTTDWNGCWGSPDDDDFSGAVIDNSGNIYFTGSTLPDGYQGNIFLTKVNFNTKTVSWSKSFDGGAQDWMPSPGENGISQGGGGSRCVAVDASGDVYITGASSQGYNEVFITKMSGSGTVIWQKFWKATSSAVSSSSAKAYSLDVAGGKVFVTGSTGAGTTSEEGMVFLLIMDASNGTVDPNTTVGIDPSPGYNDRGYVVRSPDGNNIYIAGWAGSNNSGFVMKLSSGGATLDWCKKVDVGWAGRITDMEVDATGDLYLGADLRGVSTYMGILKIDNSGNLVWSKKFQGLNNDRNNISCLRVINNTIYVGGKGSFDGYDTGQWGDGCFLKMDLNGNLISQYNFFTGEVSDEKCGERVEAILSYNGQLILLGETWSEYTQIDGKWYIANGTLSDLSVSVSSVVAPTLVTADGYVTSTTFSVSNINYTLQPISSGSHGYADVEFFAITE